MSQQLPRRSVFSVPGSSEKMVGKAREFRVDQIFLDLEDAVAAEAKGSARSVISSLGNPTFLAPIVSIRVNALDTPWFEEDMQLLESGVAQWIDSIILPKVNDPSDIERCSTVLERIETSVGLTLGSLTIDAQIESARGLVNCEAIATQERVTSLNFGPADFMADLGMPAEEVTSNEYALTRMLIAARAAGIAAVDGPTLEVRDIARFERSASRAAALGCDGKWVIHPDQIEACHRIFTPSQERFDDATELLAAYEHSTSKAGGAKGAVIHNGAMIDEASRKMALSIYHRGRAAGLEPTKRR